MFKSEHLRLNRVGLRIMGVLLETNDRVDYDSEFTRTIDDKDWHIQGSNSKNTWRIPPPNKNNIRYKNPIVQRNKYELDGYAFSALRDLPKVKAKFGR